MKSILVLIGGGERDPVVFQTALGAAKPLVAHLNFLHVHISPGVAARYAHAEFAQGEALRNALDDLNTKADAHSALAEAHIRELCERGKIEMRDTPGAPGGVTASFREEQDSGLERLTFHARHCDLVVMGRAKQAQGLPQQTLERLVLNCGRPILVTASAAPDRLTDTIMVCWKESGNSARAVAVATPLLAKAKRVVFLAIKERDEGAADAVNDLARQFAWNGIAAEGTVVQADGRKIPDLLAAAADDWAADLVVMGAYGQSRAHELLFGSCTETFIRHSDRPVLLMH